MKWGRKNSPSSSSSAKANGNGSGSGGGGGISSWISKIKQMSGNSKSPPPAKTKQKNKVNSSSPLYADDEEAYWRLSFGKESFEGKKSNTTKSVLGSDVDELQLPVSNYPSCRSITTQSFTNMVSDVRKTKELSENKDREEIMLETPRRKIQKLRKVTVRRSRRTDREDYSDSGRDSIEVNRRRSKSEQVEKDFLNLEPIKTMKNNNFKPSNARKSHYISSSNSTELRGRSIDEGNQSNLNKPDRISEEIDDSDRKIVIKTEKQRRSIDQRRDEEKRRTSKVRIYSPRTPSKVEFIKIRAIEEMKKSKLKKKKKKEEEEMEGRRRRSLESCAMVKCSYDPQNDFRDSMVEMILEKKITRPEELEELLACYLTLNSDEYHDLIIKVFKQVWFDLNRSSFSPELENQDHSYSDY